MKNILVNIMVNEEKGLSQWLIDYFQKQSVSEKGHFRAPMGFIYPGFEDPDFLSEYGSCTEMTANPMVYLQHQATNGDEIVVPLFI